MSIALSKAKKAFEENADRYLSARDGAAWNTNAGLLNLCKALEEMDAELAQIRKMITHVSQQVAQLR